MSCCRCPISYLPTLLPTQTHTQDRTEAEEACLMRQMLPQRADFISCMCGLHLSLSFGFYHIPRSGEEKTAPILQTSRPRQGSPCANGGPENCQQVKAIKKSRWTASGRREQAWNWSSKFGLWPKRSLLLKTTRSPSTAELLREQRPHRRWFPGAPARFTPCHATGAVYQSEPLDLDVSMMKPEEHREPARQKSPPRAQCCWQRQPH